MQGRGRRPGFFFQGEHEGCECHEDDFVEVEIHVHPIASSWIAKQQEILEKIEKSLKEKPKEDKPKDDDKKPKCIPPGGEYRGAVQASEFIKMRDEFCKKPTKKYEKDGFTLELKKWKSSKCPKDDCVKTVNKLWNTCESLPHLLGLLSLFDLCSIILGKNMLIVCSPTRW